MKNIKTSEYVNLERREYSLYVMTSRAICSVTDGLKAAGRRALWVGRNGSKYKVAVLAGATMPIHPHAECSGAIQTLAAPYGNNIPLFKGDGAFGTLINPTAYGAARYTAVTVSKFAQEVVLADIEIIPMMENYDGTLMEPIHFLPLVPISLLNPSEGIAVGFASNILPRKLDDIINIQLAHLKGAKKLPGCMPYFGPIDSLAVSENVNGDTYSYTFHGKYTQKDSSTLVITQLPYSQTHAKVIDKLDALEDKGIVLDYKDKSKNVIDITVKFKRGYLNNTSEADILKMLGLTINETENLNVLDFSGQHVWSTRPTKLITEFTDWRLGYYVQRYQRLSDLLKLDLSRLYDIRTAIKNKVGGKANTIKSRTDLKTYLETIKIVNLDYIADLGIYRFTEEENEKNEKRIKEAEEQLREYEEIINSREKQVDIYTAELKTILQKYTKGEYTK